HRAAVTEVLISGTRQCGRRAVHVAQLLGALVDQVRAGGRRAPCIVDAVTELDENLGAGERNTARLQPGTVKVDLVQDLRREIPRLWTEDGDRVPADAVRRIHHQL